MPSVSILTLSSSLRNKTILMKNDDQLSNEDNLKRIIVKTTEEYQYINLPICCPDKNADLIIAINQMSGEYEVECILDKRFVRGHPEYLVKWMGYSLDECTWEGTKNLKNVISLVIEYEEAQNIKKEEEIAHRKRSEQHQDEDAERKRKRQLKKNQKNPQIINIDTKEEIHNSKSEKINQPQEEEKVISKYKCDEDDGYLHEEEKLVDKYKAEQDETNIGIQQEEKPLTKQKPEQKQPNLQLAAFLKKDLIYDPKNEQSEQSTEELKVQKTTNKHAEKTQDIARAPTKDAERAPTKETEKTPNKDRLEELKAVLGLQQSLQIEMNITQDLEKFSQKYSQINKKLKGEIAKERKSSLKKKTKCINNQILVKGSNNKTQKSSKVIPQVPPRLDKYRKIESEKGEIVVRIRQLQYSLTNIPEYAVEYSDGKIRLLNTLALMNGHHDYYLSYLKERVRLPLPD